MGGKQRGIAKPRSRLAGALRKLEEALARDPKSFTQRAREFSLRFRDYSPLNRGLIFLQRPDATFVKGRKQWQSEGREVKRGVRAIHILAPAVKAGESAETARFVQAKVYDISDTSGPPFEVPVLAPAALQQGAPSAELLGQLEEWVRGSGLRLEYKTPAVNKLVDGATDGLTIWIRPDLGAAERVIVLAHEIAHVKLHLRRKQRGQALLIETPGQPRSRDTREMEAELTAFLILELSGIDSSEASAIYLNCWKASLMKKIREHTQRAFTAACSVLRDCERRRYRCVVGEGATTVIRDVLAAL